MFLITFSYFIRKINITVAYQYKKYYIYIYIRNLKHFPIIFTSNFHQVNLLSFYNLGNSLKPNPYSTLRLPCELCSFCVVVFLVHKGLSCTIISLYVMDNSIILQNIIENKNQIQLLSLNLTSYIYTINHKPSRFSLHLISLIL